MNRLRRPHVSLNTSGFFKSIILSVVVVLTLLAILSLANPTTAILVLLSGLFVVRLIHGEEPPVRICTMKNLGKSIAFSDDQKKRFIALSIVEMATESATRFGNDDSEMRGSKILRATRILAEHVGSFGIEVDVTREAVRYSVSASANTVVEACEEAETLAERIVRIVRGLYGEDTHARILEGQNLQGVFKRIVGGDFETLTSIGCVALCHKRVANDVSGFSLLTVTHESIGTIDLRRLISIMQDLGVDVSYVINLKAQRVFNENSLIDRLGQGQIWVFSSYFVVNERSVNTTREAAHRLKNSIEDITRAGTLRIEKGSTTIRKVGSILARSTVGKKLLFSNSQLIAHIYPIRYYHESVFNDVDEKGSNREDGMNWRFTY